VAASTGQKFYKNQFAPGSAPGPAGAAYSAVPDLPVGEIEGLTAPQGPHQASRPFGPRYSVPCRRKSCRRHC